MAISQKQAAVLSRLAGKKPEQMTFALIENAADVIGNSKDWLGGFRQMLQNNGYQLELLDLRMWRGRKKALRAKLQSKDVIWLGGGNTFYLRWILKETGADNIIRDLVDKGKIYAGWSAGAVVAGPTLKYFESMDDISESPEMIMDGLNLINSVVVPHLDNKDFADDAKEANQKLRHDGYNTIVLNDDQVLIINGDEQNVI